MATEAHVTKGIVQEVHKSQGKAINKEYYRKLIF